MLFVLIIAYFCRNYKTKETGREREFDKIWEVPGFEHLPKLVIHIMVFAVDMPLKLTGASASSSGQTVSAPAG